MFEEMPVLSSLSQLDWEKVKDLFIEKHFGKDEYIFFEGDPSSWLGVVLEGRVKMIKHSEAGKDVVLDVLSPGEMLGEVAAFNGKPLPGHGPSHGAHHGGQYSPRRLPPSLEAVSCPGAAGDRGTGASARQAQEMIKSMAVDRVERRIARILLKLAATTGSSNEEGIVIEMPLTRQDIAEMAGTTVETAIRTMSKFRKKGLVQTKQGRVMILEPHQLVRIAEEF